ncbi:MAG: GNAT family N-acetyltransferase [Neobacillus sp.]|jgi:ribosomal protein S18 acetylase RimI-like enzyme
MKRMNVVVRRANVEDIQSLKGLMFQYIVDFYKKPRPAEEDLTGLIQHLQNNPASGLQFVAEKDGELVGFATLYFTFSTLQVKKAAILNDLFVSPEARGLKVGENLFQTCLAYIRENGYAYMTWETAKDNVVAQSLYNKSGGQISDWLVYEIE